MGKYESGSSHSVKEEMNGILLFVGLIWAVHLLGWLVPSLQIQSYGLAPGQVSGLVGILTMPFLHGGIGHLVSNSIPLFVLLALLAGSRGNSAAVVTLIVLANGVLLWAFSLQRDSVHIGASGLVYGLISFLMLSGVLERRAIPLLVSAIVLVVFGCSTSLWIGMLPRQGVSWDGHLYGAAAGVLVAYGLTRDRAQPAAA